MFLNFKKIYPKFIFSKITFGVLFCSRFILINSLNHHNEDFIYHVCFWFKGRFDLNQIKQDYIEDIHIYSDLINQSFTINIIED